MSYYTITNVGPATAELRIDGPIGYDWYEETTTSKLLVEELDKIIAPTINLYLNSPGGSVMDANVIYAALKRHPAKVNCIIDGWALSAASLIAMAGDTISIGQRSLLMIHNPRTVAEGDAPKLRKSADILDKVKTGMVETYNARLQQDADAVAALLDAETWYSASEAVAAGLADSIIPDTAAPAPVPDKIRNHFSFIPAAYAAYLEFVMTHEPVKENPSTPAVTDAVIESTAASTESPAGADATESAPVSAHADLAVISAAVQTGLNAERARVKTIRAAFAPWLKRGYDLTALQSQCEDDGLDVAEVNARLLTALGGMAEPLASPAQGQADSDPLAEAMAAYRAAHPNSASSDAVIMATVLRDNPKLYDAHLASKKGA